jgi:hypothetical protein
MQCSKTAKHLRSMKSPKIMSQNLLEHLFTFYYAFFFTQWFVPICIKHHSYIWLGISLFDSKHLYNNVLLLTCSISYFVFICGFMEL